MTHIPTLGPLAIILSLSLSLGCQGGPPEHAGGDVDAPDTQKAEAKLPEGFHGAFASQIQEAHGGEAWRSKDVIIADVQLTKEGNIRLDGTFTFETTGGQVRLDPKAGGRVVFDGENAWISPPDLSMAKPRFQILTWPYFIAAPFKLTDPGTHMTNNQEKMLMGAPYPSAKLTFGEGVGDSPDDWYVIYREPESQRLKSMAYIVTYGKDIETAESAPHAIVYDDFKTIEGVTLATKWSLYDWNEEQGPYGDPLTEGTLTNIRFADAAPDTFKVPAGAKEIGLD